MALHTPSPPTLNTNPCTPAPRDPCEAAISQIAPSCTTNIVPFFNGRKQLYRTPLTSSGDKIPLQNGIVVITGDNPRMRLELGWNTSFARIMSGVCFWCADVDDLNCPIE